MKNQRILKPVVNPLLAAAFIGLVSSSASIIANANVSASDCKGAACQGRPAYTLRITTHGEGTNRSDNMSEVGRQDNRRADVSITTSVPGKTVVKEVTETVQVKVRDAETRNLSLPDGGVIWLTQDPASITPTLNVSTQGNAVLEEGAFKSPISFTVDSNYTTFIDHWNLSVYRKNDPDADAVVSLDGKQLTDAQLIEWNGQVAEGESLKVGEELEYVLTVYDTEGHSDKTRERTILLTSDSSSPEKIAEQLAEQQNKTAEIQSKFFNGLSRQTIPVHGAKVRLHGQDIVKGNKLTINGKAITLDTNQKFATEYLLPVGEHKFDIAIENNNGKKYTKQLNTDIDGQYMFMVGIADVTVGESKVTGNIEPLEVDQGHYDGDIFVDGRLAFYLKGKIKGKYLVTAQMDTGTEDIKDLFDDLHKKDPRSLFRRLDPDKYYPVYGDDSTLIDDADSQGKMYVRVDWDKSRAIWGNYNTSLTGTEYAQFNRSLYGGKLHHKSTQLTESGEHKIEASVFASETQSAFRHNQFLGTGGSLYYLKDHDIVKGSEKIWVEIRQRESDRAVEKIVLLEGRDYEIDDFQGRIILSRPLQQVAGQSGPSIIKDTPLDGNSVFLMVDYEYVPDNFAADKATYGGRGKTWLNDNIAVGGTWVHENRSGTSNSDDYDVKGVDITVKHGRGTYVKAEFATSESRQTAGSFLSDDGGLNFNAFAGNAFAENSAPANITGDAYSIEARVNLKELDKGDATVGAWVKKREAGFSTAGLDNGVDTVDAGVEGRVKINEKLDLAAKATMLDKDGQSTATTASLEANLKATDKLTIGAEVRHVKDDLVTGQDGEGTLAAVKIGLDVKPDINVYGIAQTTIATKGSYADNDLYTVGIKARLNEKFSMKGELSAGDRGEGALFGIDYAVTDSYGVYGTYTLSTGRTDSKRGIFTLGQRKTISDQLKIYTEHQYTHEDTQSGIGNTFGLDYKLNDETTANVSLQAANLDNDNGGTTERNAISAGLTYQAGPTRATTRLEYRTDKATGVDTEQWVTSNRGNYQVNPSMRLQGKLNYSQTTDNIGNSKDASFTEAGIGVAYRPIDNDRLNMLGRVTYTSDLKPLEQTDQPDERDVIASAEAAYDLNQAWEIGAKLAYKKGEIRQDRDAGKWHDNDAKLASIRARYHLTKKWDGLVQYHWLQSDASKDTQHGAVVSVDRHVGENLKIGVGYNFTTFTDDLRDTESDATGWFANFVGKY